MANPTQCDIWLGDVATNMVEAAYDHYTEFATAAYTLATQTIGDLGRFNVQPVQFNVTSLDVIHSFWAYTLGVKADANPGVNDVAYATPNTVGDFQVRCDELCGIWHGSMYDTGQVMSDSGFMAWTQATAVKKTSPGTAGRLRIATV